MRKIYLLYFLFPASDYAEAQSLRKPIAAAYTGLGAYSINHVDVFSITANQAALAQIKNPSLGVSGEKRFLLEDANMCSLIGALPTTQGNFALQADYFGHTNYNESQLGIAYARELGTKLDIGVKFNYYSFRIPGYQNSSAVNFEIGTIVHLTEQLNAGIHFYNPVGGNLSKTDHEKLSSVYTFGIGYEASESFLIGTEIVKQEELPVNVNVGMQYNFDKKFFARFGIASQTASPCFGAGVSWDNFRIDVSASYHPQLGISPGLMMIVNFKPGNAEEK